MKQTSGKSSQSRSERGYTLVALLSVMSLIALFALAAAPQVRQQAQREREKEAIFRGEQVADAIRSYYRYRGSQGIIPCPPRWSNCWKEFHAAQRNCKSCESEAARDPLSSTGEWKLIEPTSQELGEFVKVGDGLFRRRAADAAPRICSSGQSDSAISRHARYGVH